MTTTEPAICAIVWGETEDFGRFNNSLAMDGTGIIQHDIGLPDLEPGREYVYVLQVASSTGGNVGAVEIRVFGAPAT